MMKEMMMSCLMDHTMQCGKLKMTFQKAENGNQGVMKPMEDFNLMMMSQTMTKPLRTMMKMTMITLIKMMKMTVVIITSDML